MNLHEMKSLAERLLREGGTVSVEAVAPLLRYILKAPTPGQVEGDINHQITAFATQMDDSPGQQVAIEVLENCRERILALFQNHSTRAT
jgi:hypothetical protein